MAGKGDQEYREMLQAFQKETQAQLDAAVISSRPVKLDQQAIGRLSRMDAISNQQMALAQKTRAQATLASISDAFERLDAGEFGFCEDCGEAIPDGRLRLNPTVRLCVECARG